MKYESVDLSKEQKELLDQWFSVIDAEDATHPMVVFRMAMQ